MRFTGIPLLLAAAFHVQGPRQDEHGLMTYTLTSEYQQGQNDVQVLLPDKLEKGRRYPVLYVLPVYASGSPDASGMPEAKRLNLHNEFGLICVGPCFDRTLWYADHPTDPKIRQESYLLNVVLPFVEQNLPALQEPRGRLLVGFSKSGWGAFSLLLRHPDVFGRAASWDAPLTMQSPGRFETPMVFATQENFDRYKITSLLQQRAELLKRGPARLVLLGHGNFVDDDLRLHEQMLALGIPHHHDHGPKRAHAWTSGWLRPAVALLTAGVLE
ncbi:MAG: hypothetical protein FJ279_20895 [Planctomycetes bacterium]|nr:hypothetical protein [Planctomycetota bacterium]MBM4080677.1 hypothetical protein [Planctomycetota bacterium]